MTTGFCHTFSGLTLGGRGGRGGQLRPLQECIRALKLHAQSFRSRCFSVAITFNVEAMIFAWLAVALSLALVLRNNTGALASLS